MFLTVVIWGHTSLSNVEYFPGFVSVALFVVLVQLVSITDSENRCAPVGDKTLSGKIRLQQKSDNRSFFTEGICTCHSRKTNFINDGSIKCLSEPWQWASEYNIRNQELVQLNEMQLLLKLEVKLVLFLLWKMSVKVSALVCVYKILNYCLVCLCIHWVPAPVQLTPCLPEQMVVCSQVTLS